MDIGTIQSGESAVFSGEGQKQVGSPEHDRLGTLRLAQLSASGKEHAALCIGDPAFPRHCDVGRMNLVQHFTLWPHNPRGGDPTIESRLHHNARTDNAHRPQTSCPDRGIHLRDRVDQRQW